MDEWDLDAVRRLFNSLEFRTLLDRLEDLDQGAKPAVEAASIDVRTGTVEDLERAARTGPAALHLLTDATGEVRGMAISPGGGEATFAATSDPTPALIAWLGDASAAKWVHDAKQTRAALLTAGCELRGVEFDTLLAGHLLDPAEASYPLDALCRTYLGLDVLEAAET